MAKKDKIKQPVSSSSHSKEAQINQNTTNNAKRDIILTGFGKVFLIRDANDFD